MEEPAMAKERTVRNAQWECQDIEIRRRRQGHRQTAKERRWRGSHQDLAQTETDNGVRQAGGHGMDPSSGQRVRNPVLECGGSTPLWMVGCVVIWDDAAPHARIPSALGTALSAEAGAGATAWG